MRAPLSMRGIFQSIPLPGSTAVAVLGVQHRDPGADRYQLSGADVYFRLSADHSRALVRAAVAQGGERLPPLETTPFATLFKARPAPR